MDESLKEISAQLSAVLNRMEAERVGTARQSLWTAEDGWLVGYTTSRIVGGPFNGKFATMVYKPVLPHSGQGWERVYYVAASTRKLAKSRAIKHYAKHSPKWAKRNAWA
jgi:hypothetical protein